MTVGESLTADTLHALEDEWRALGANSDNVFATWEWISTWWKHFGRERPLRLQTLRRPDGTGAAILPLYLATRRPVRVLRFLGHGPSDQLGPVCRPADRPVAAALFARALDASEDWDLMIGDELPRDADWCGIPGSRRLGTQATPVVDLSASTWEEWIATRSRNWRGEHAKKSRRLAREGTVRHRVTADPDELATDLETLLMLHGSRWRGAGGSRAFAGREAFHREFAEIALRRGWLRLRLVELDGRPVAALYNLRFGTAEYAYQAGRAPGLDRCSVGFLLHARAIRDALAEGATEYRFLRGAEPYKQRFADHDPGVETIAITRGAAARAALAGVARMDRYPRWARRRVPASLAWGTGGSPVWGPP